MRALQHFRPLMCFTLLQQLFFTFSYSTSINFETLSHILNRTYSCRQVSSENKLSLSNPLSIQIITLNLGKGIKSQHILLLNRTAGVSRESKVQVLWQIKENTAEGQGIRESETTSTAKMCNDS